MPKPQRQESSGRPSHTGYARPGQIVEIATRRTSAEAATGSAESAVARLWHTFLKSDWLTYLAGLAVGAALAAVLLLVLADIL